MKVKTIYVASFLLAFLGVMGILIILNQNFTNIFAFDFSIAKEKTVDHKIIKLNENDYGRLCEFIKSEFKEEIIDSLDRKYFEVKTDTVYKVIVKDSSLLSRLGDAKESFKSTNSRLKKKESEITALRNKFKTTSDSVYKAWIKSTVKLYESMDSKQAAKIIVNYSDKVARDIIYSMKKKKAAEILSRLNPETVINLTNAK